MSQSAFEAWTRDGKAVLIVLASRPERDAVLNASGFAQDLPLDAWIPLTLRPGIELLMTGVGKANSAAGTACALDPDRHALVINMGVGGALPRESTGPLAVGLAVAGSMSLFADEGVQTPSGWTSMAELGFPLLENQRDASSSGGGGGESVDAIVSDPAALAIASNLCDHTAAISTVSTCSGTDASAMQTARRTRAWVEAMEGAAVGLVATRLGVPFVEIRVISNRTGDRDRQGWVMGRALQRLGQLVRQI